ncbi:MAG: winged helix-turn-helix domain-containing protein [Methyloglobulus sp.]|nr:winged helix-turn-helix domain-containing protein [Methyloglobulus sp.]
MTEVLFFLSVGFVGYLVYALVDEQRALTPGVPDAIEEPVTAVKPSTAKTPRKTAAATKAKTATPTKKPTAKPIALSTDPILAYLGKNGLTTIAKISRELPESRKLIQDRIDRLVQEGAISLATVRNAKAVALKV